MSDTPTNIYADDTRIVTNRHGDMLRVTVADGKYTLVQDKDGKQVALRYGQEWRDLVGDNLTLALGHELEAARVALRKISCVYCGRVVSLDEEGASDKLATHITTCEKHPLVALVKEISAIGEEAITLLKLVTDALPTRRDWLDPDLERQVREFIARTTPEDTRG